MERTNTDAALDDLVAGMEQLALERLSSGGDIPGAKRGGGSGGNGGANGLSEHQRMLDDAQFAELQECIATVRALAETGQGDFQAMRNIRQLLSRDTSPPIADVVGAGGVQATHALLRELLFNGPNGANGVFASLAEPERVSAALEAVWAINNIASGPTVFTEAVVADGALDLVVPIALSHPDAELATLGAWTIGNVAGDGFALRDACIAAGGIDAVIGAIQNHARKSDGSFNLSLLRNCSWALSNLARFKPSPAKEHVEKIIVMARQILGFVPDDEVVADCLWVFAYAVEGSAMEEVLQYVADDAELLAGISQSLLSRNVVLSSAALRVAGNMVSGNDAQTEAMLRAGAFENILQAVANNHFGTRVVREAFWFFSNVAAGTHVQIQRLLETGVAGVEESAAAFSVTAILSPNFPQPVKKEAMWTVANMFAGGTMQQKAALIQLGGVHALMHFCVNCSPGCNRPTVDAALEGATGAMEALQQLGWDRGSCAPDDARAAFSEWLLGAMDHFSNARSLVEIFVEGADVNALRERGGGGDFDNDGGDDGDLGEAPQFA